MQGYQFFAAVASTLQFATTSLLKSSTMNEILSDFAALVHFKNTVATEGINRPMLIGFDAGEHLRKAIPSLDAIERLDFVTAGKNDYRNRRIQGPLNVYTTKAIEALNTSLDDTISHFKATLESFKSTADEFEEKLESAACRAENVPDGENFRAPVRSAYISAMHRRDAMDLLNSFAQAISLITIPSLKDISPESIDEYNEQYSQVARILEDKFGVVYDGERFTSDGNRVSDEFKPTEGSAGDKDYDLEALVLCLRACRNVIDGLEKLCDHSEDVYAGLASAKEDVDPSNFTGDTTGATPALEEGDTPTDGSASYVLANNFIWIASFLIGKCLETCTHFMDISQRILEAVGNPDAGADETKISSPSMMTTQAPTDGVAPQNTGDTVMAEENELPTNGTAKDAEGNTIQSQVAPDVEEGEATVKDLVDTAEMFATFEEDTNVTINITTPAEGGEGDATDGAAAADLGSGDPNATPAETGTEGDGANA